MVSKPFSFCHAELVSASRRFRNEFGMTVLKWTQMKTFERIYKIVSLIPKGKVLTYKKVADLAGVKNPRVVGFAMYANKNIEQVPCHRVVGSNGKLTGYARGGIQRKKEILEKEGVHFLDDQTVDLNKSMYNQQKPYRSSHLLRV